MSIEIGDVGIAGEEPQQFVHDRLQVQLLRRHHREAGAEIKAHLVAEHAFGACTGAVGLGDAMFAHVAHEIEIRLHRGALARRPAESPGSGRARQVAPKRCKCKPPGAVAPK